jgi:site-specific DNA-methyltransferase (adenine-specific)
MLTYNAPQVMDGRKMLEALPGSCAAAVFFDPQYRGVLDKLDYGNEGQRQKKRADLPQMDTSTITLFINQISRVLRPSGHMFLWVDKFHLCEATHSEWASNTELALVDMVIWDKLRIGMGYRTRRRSEYLLVYQKPPKRAKDIWTDRGIPDVWAEKAPKKQHAHAKPPGLIKRLVESTSQLGDLIVDPAAGTYVTLDICQLTGRQFVGCDISG